MSSFNYTRYATEFKFRLRSESAALHPSIPFQGHAESGALEPRKCSLPHRGLL